jgi:glycerol-3-phosphate acyltransferase PlsY
LRTGIIIGTFDFFAKGTLPVVIAKLLDLSLGIQVAAGLVAVLGHNWSPFMRFTGGRGVATAMGVCIGFGLWQEALVLGLVIGVIGRLIFRDTGFWTLIAMITLPVLTAVFDRPSEVITMAIAIVIILVAKRLIANGEAPATSHPLLQVLTYRLLWDRDVSHRTSWTRRAPNG